MSGSGQRDASLRATMTHCHYRDGHATLATDGARPRPVRTLFDLSDDALRRIGATRRTAGDEPLFPCRVSLEDAPAGAELLLLPYEHHPAASPYRASGPIYVRRGAARSDLAPGEVPPYVTRRLISVRAYDRDAMMVAGSVCDGPDVARELDALFSAPR